MKLGSGIVLLILAIGLSPASEVLPCCEEVNASQCRRTCEQLSADDPAEARAPVLTRLSQDCPQAKVGFWQCINETFAANTNTSESLQTTTIPSKGASGAPDFWPGRACCELAFYRKCQSSCQRANSLSDLRPNCKSSQEPQLFQCIAKREEGAQCCSAETALPCQTACKVVFHQPSNPTPPQLDAVSQQCGTNVNSCVLNYTRSVTVVQSKEYLPCCQRADTLSCQSQCQEILTTMTGDEQVMRAMMGACGEIILTHDFWQCIYRTGDELKPRPLPNHNHQEYLGIDAAKLLCCDKARTSKCRNLCLQTFGKGMSHSWNQFYDDCADHPQEMELNLCRHEVNSPCEVGCSGLEYCSNFNNRPTEMFRSCSAAADHATQRDMYLWRQDRVTIPALRGIPLHSLYYCDPELLKAVACTLNIKPCHAQSATTTICRSDCINFLSKCVDWDQLPPEQNAASLCNRLAPHDHDCIPLKNFQEPSPLSTSLTRHVSQPCHPNPCTHNKVCVINKRKCRRSETCRTYICKPACQMGDDSLFLVPHKSFARFLEEDSTHCYKTCRCSKHNRWSKCKSIGCVGRDSCLVDTDAGDRQDVQAHGSHFMQGCRQCICFSGEVICLDEPCRSARSLHQVSLPCNCAANYQPVCASNGQTFPNECVARCSRVHGQWLRPGACHTSDPCQRKPCQVGEICLPHHRICLNSGEVDCPQYECVSASGDCNHHHHDPACDTNEEEFTNLCLLKTHGQQLAYHGHCQTNCHESGAVCGYDGETYMSECAALAARVPVDYSGACRAAPSIQSEYTQSYCYNVGCPKRGYKGCQLIRPPGGCCSVCAGLLRVLFSKRQADTISSAASIGALTVSNITSVLSGELTVAECEVFAYISPYRDLVVMVLPTVRHPSQLQIQVCITEAEKLGLIMQFNSPRFTVHLEMAPLVAAYVQMPEVSMATCTHLSPWLLVFWVFHVAWDVFG